MFKLPHNCTHFTYWQGHAQNLSSQASTVCEPRTSRCTLWIQKKQRNQRSSCQHPLIIDTARGFQKNIYFCFIDYAKAFDYVDHNKLWKILRDGNTLLAPEKPVFRSKSNSWNQPWNNRLVQNWERSILRLYIVTLFN